jgi:hypothetical protein
MGRITSCPLGGASGTLARVSAMVCPLRVMQSPCSRPALSSIFITCGMPPARCRSVAT